MDRLSPTRRALLRGGLVLGAAGASPAVTATAIARPRRVTDYPIARWNPASVSNYTTVNRPWDRPVEFIVVHVTQVTYDTTIRIFQDPRRRVSAHYVVRSADGHVGQCVRDKDIAWHAGNWDYNTRSIGIEHEGWVDRPEYFTQAMFESSAALTAHVCALHRIPVERHRIIGHSEVPGATHTDPGILWNWTRYLTLVEARMGAAYRSARRARRPVSQSVGKPV